MTDDASFCPVYASIELLQEKWTLHIIRALLESPQGFNELGRTVGANPTTLAHRLERLEALGVLERTVHSVMPPRTSYSLTPAGVALQDVIDAIDRWSRQHLAAPAKEKPRRGPRLTPSPTPPAGPTRSATGRPAAGRAPGR